MSLYRRGAEPACPLQHPGCAGVVRSRDSKSCHNCAKVAQLDRLNQRPRPIIGQPRASSPLAPPEQSGSILAALRKGPQSLDALAQTVGCTAGQALDGLHALRASGSNIHEFGSLWSLEKQPAQTGRTFEYVSRPDHTFVFGVCSDQHLGSKYARHDVLTSLYDWFAERRVDRVFNAGNWIDGEDEKNKHDIAVHGFEPQIDHLVRQYPQRSGLHTYAVWGEDHEGWFARRESIDVGRFAENRMREAGRVDWHDLGFMEAKIDLVNASTGQRSSLLVMHPGGGTAYALSYRPQKLVESLQGGEKPAVILIGHYHKMSMNLIRSVWALQIGAVQDQTPFMRKIPTEPHIGGGIVTLEQDPRTGAITGCVPAFRQWFNVGYYNDRWSKSGDAVLPPKEFVGPRQGGRDDARPPRSRDARRIRRDRPKPRTRRRG